MSVKYELNGHSYNYLFLYDGLNRLTTANSYDKTGNGIPYSELYEYDKMGNINYLERKLGANKTDALNIEYTGNQIKKVSSVSPALGYDFGSITYPDLSDASIDYYYDNNGNLIKNLDKGVVATRHNFLNLPDTIQFQNGNQIINSYLADGRKVKAVYKTYSTGIVVPQDAVYHGNASYDVSTDEWDGHYMYRSYAYYYYVHDHWGNVRITHPFNLMRSGGFLYNLNKTQRSLVYLKWEGRKLNKGNNYEIHPFKGKVPNRGNAAIYIKP